MRLISVAIRNYRVHQELEVAFDTARTVIGGSNEAGKSTLVEAIHRALFLRARVTGKMQKEMVSAIHGGQPEVELSFACAKGTYRIIKRFSGSTGTATLIEPGGAALHGDAAEARLADLLRVEPVSGPKAAGWALECWNHLWVWQGSAGANPKTYANEQRDSLLTRLQHSGGAGMMQSENDASVAARITTLHDSIFTRNGSPKKGSDLARALELEAATNAEVEQARVVMEKLRRASEDFESAHTYIAAVKLELPALERQREEIEARLIKARELRAAETVQQLSADSAVKTCAELTTASQQIEELRQQASTAKAKLARTEETERLQQRDSEARQRLNEFEKQQKTAAEAARVLRLQAELARAHVAFFEKLANRDAIRARAAQVRELRQHYASREAALIKSPGISTAALRNLQSLENQCATAQAALAAMAAQIEVVDSDSAIKVGKEMLRAGESRLLTDEAEIDIHPGVKLRIRPGGGTALAERRAQAQALQERFRQALAANAVATVAEAVESAERRQAQEQEIRAGKTRLGDLGSATIEQELARAETACTAAAEEVRRRAAATSQLLGPSDLADAARQYQELEKQLRAAEDSDRSATIARDNAARGASEAADMLHRHRKAVATEQDNLARLQGQLALLVARYGEDISRAEALQHAQLAKDKAAEALAVTRRALKEQHTDELETLRASLSAKINEKQAARNEAEQRRSAANALLQSDGTSDPQASLIIAEARLNNARDQLATVRGRANAIQLLDQLFTDEQVSLANRFSAPLAERITGYVQCLFGPDATAAVRLDGGDFGGLEISRPSQAGVAFDFETLSGGTREQVAAAARLAMAEVLAESFDGSLPIVFDDAFAYSDPERAATLQRMLDRAASRGLQLIVVTCNPADYASFEAKKVILSKTPSELAIPPKEQAAAPVPSAAAQNTCSIKVATDDAASSRALASVTVTEGQRQALLAALQAGGGSMKNGTLREVLNWDAKTYDAVKQDLLSAKRLVAAQGRNALVTLADQLLF